MPGVGFASAYVKAPPHPIDGVLHRLEHRMPKVSKPLKSLIPTEIRTDRPGERQPHEGKRKKPEGHHSVAKLQPEK